jgi:hypothetical protein
LAFATVDRVTMNASDKQIDVDNKRTKSAASERGVTPPIERIFKNCAFLIPKEPLVIKFSLRQITGPYSSAGY